MSWLAEKPWTTIVIPGNHEGWRRLMTLPSTFLFDAKVYEYRTKQGPVYFAHPGSIFYINNLKFLSIPKASSTDRIYRIEGRDWWPEEVLTKQEENLVLDELDKVNWEVDYVLSHTCPAQIIPEFMDNPYDQTVRMKDPVADFLEFIDNRLSYKKWFFGHFHNEREYLWAGDYYKCCYKEINELKIDK